MVRLSQSLCKYVPEWYNLQKSSSSFFRKQNLFFMTRFIKGIAWNQYKQAMNRYYYHLKSEDVYASQRSQMKRDNNRSRIAAACEEHNFSYPHLMSTLPKIDIHLNLYALSRLAIYEPKTFKSLVDICREVASEPLPPANFDPKRIDLERDQRL